jgi:hypothetical protein
MTALLNCRPNCGLQFGLRLQRNRHPIWLALPINARNSIKLYASDGVSARTGDSYKLYGIAWQYRWGGGI